MAKNDRSKQRRKEQEKKEARRREKERETRVENKPVVLGGITVNTRMPRYFRVTNAEKAPEIKRGIDLSVDTTKTASTIKDNRAAEVPIEHVMSQTVLPAVAVTDKTVANDTLWQHFGAHVDADRKTTSFRVYAPNATMVELIRPGNNWGEQSEPLQRLDNGEWTITLPEDLSYTEYKYRISNVAVEPNYQRDRIDPFSGQLSTHLNERGGHVYNSVVGNSQYKWQVRHIQPGTHPMSIYELHLSTFLPGNYRQIGEKIAAHVKYLGFTHVQIMPPFQTPIHESWGYLVGCPYALNDGYGTVDDFKYMVDHLHQHGLGVIIDVPIGFGIQDWDCGLSCYDGTDLFHYSGARGWNAQWKTRIYDHTKPFVRDYLIGLFTYLYHELGIDGARIDAVAAQIFLDYDRGNWDWPRNKIDELSDSQKQIIESLGGDRYFADRKFWLSEAVDFPALFFYRELHQRLQKCCPGFFTIAEESRRVLPNLATPVELGGLGFNYAQDMAEMHRMRAYLRMPEKDRKIEMVEAALLEPYKEQYVNPMNTHDECANGKTRLFTELRSHLPLIGLAALCWFRPGAPMLFQGDEFCEEGWFDVKRMLDWNKTGPDAKLHQKQMVANIHDLNHILSTEAALSLQNRSSVDRIGSCNDQRWHAFVRWGNLAANWENTDNLELHKDDLVFIRSENPHTIRRQAEIHLPVPGKWKVIYNSIDERYIGVQPYNRHDPYWSVESSGHNVSILLQPLQALALKRTE